MLSSMDGGEKVRENRLRRMAERQGLRLERSRRRDPRARDFGRYALIDEATGSPVNPKLSDRWRHSWTLEEVERHLTEEER